MASTLGISALSVRLLLLALLSLSGPPTGAGADTVTWRKCRELTFALSHREDGRRVPDYPSDNNATKLDLKLCHVTEIKRGDFDGLPNIDTMLLGSNDIVHVDPAAFKSTQKLTHLSLWVNKLREPPVFDEPSLFPNLIELDLQWNKFREIPHDTTFSACIHLQELNLAYNQIEHIHPHVFRPLTQLTDLVLMFNKLTYVPKSMFKNNNKLKHLVLDNNRISYLPTNFVTGFNNAGLEYFLFDHNPWHCACLLELLVEVKRVGGLYYNYYGGDYIGRKPVCVYSGAYPCSRHAPSGLLRAPPRAPASSSYSP